MVPIWTAYCSNTIPKLPETCFTSTVSGWVEPCTCAGPKILQIDHRDTEAFLKALDIYPKDDCILNWLKKKQFSLAAMAILVQT